MSSFRRVFLALIPIVFFVLAFMSFFKGDMMKAIFWGVMLVDMDLYVLSQRLGNKDES